jgi:hypothetical protein
MATSIISVDMVIMPPRAVAGTSRSSNPALIPTSQTGRLLA